MVCLGSKMFIFWNVVFFLIYHIQFAFAFCSLQVFSVHCFCLPERQSSILEKHPSYWDDFFVFWGFFLFFGPNPHFVRSTHVCAMCKKVKIVKILIIQYPIFSYFHEMLSEVLNEQSMQQKTQRYSNIILLLIRHNVLILQGISCPRLQKGQNCYFRSHGEKETRQTK